MNRVRKFFEDWTIFEKIWLCLSIVLMITLSIIWGEKPLALISGLAGVISVVLCAKGKLINYGFGMVQAVTYIFLCYESKIYGEVMYNVAMIPMIIIGFLSWRKHMKEEQEEVQTRNLSLKGWLVLIVTMILSVWGYCAILMHIGGNFAFLDATSTVLSAIASILMIARYSEQWLVWIFVNITSIVLWVYAFSNGDTSAITMIVMWSAYLLNSIYGYINWRKLAKNNR